MLILAGIVSIGPLVNLLEWWDFTAKLLTNFSESYVKKLLYSWYPTVIFISLIAGISFAHFQKMWITLVFCVTAGLLGYMIKDQNIYIVMLETFLPTLIHVYFFTGLFMLYGALKTKSIPGLVSVACLVICALLILNYSFAKFTIPSKGTIQAYNDSTFYSIIEKTIQTFQLKIQYSNKLNITIIKLQSFMAFAYTYHYLNWFSKTSIIKWHKVDKKQLLFIGAFWMVSVGLYYYNYRVGLSVLFLMSMIHVFLEFPLNVASIKGIWGITLGKKTYGT